MSIVLSVDDLTRSFGDLKAVDGVSFRIEEGETYGLLGPNGAGKTTTISMICGLLQPDHGTVTVSGRRIGPREVAAKSAIGLVPQELALYPDLTAEENLVFFGRLYGLGGDQLKSRVDDVLEVIGLVDRRSDLIKEYSGGMKRRLNIGIGMLNSPQLLILDEPTVGVDPQSRHAILESVEQLSGAGMAVLYTTHYMEEAERLCDRVGIIDQGQIRAEGTRRELVGLVGELDRVLVTGTGDLAGGAEALHRLEGVVGADAADGSIEVLAGDASSMLPRVLSTLAGIGVSVSGVAIFEPNLEAVFLHLTGKALRD